MRDSIVKLGTVISKLGTTRFFSAMQRFIGGTVMIDVMHVSIWHTDPHLGRLVEASTIHGAELHETGIGNRLPATLIEQILDPDGPQLIHVVPRQFDDDGSAVTPVHRCIILMRRVRTHFVIFLQRETERGDFLPDELASLGELSQALLPLVEQHASMQQSSASDATDEIALPPDEPAALSDSAADTLSQRFRERLEQQNITLSSREQQVCILILSGYTLPAICDELDLRASTVETYLKRARIKLCLSGRHGLSRWMIE